MAALSHQIGPDRWSRDGAAEEQCTPSDASCGGDNSASDDEGTACSAVTELGDSNACSEERNCAYVGGVVCGEDGGRPLDPVEVGWLVVEAGSHLTPAALERDQRDDDMQLDQAAVASSLWSRAGSYLTADGRAFAAGVTRAGPGAGVWVGVRWISLVDDRTQRDGTQAE